MGARVWTVRDALEWTSGYLDEHGDPAPRRSAEWLICAATGLSRVEVYTLWDRPLSEDERATLREGVRRRAEGEPLQHVTGEMPFRHLVVRVGPGVFIPRPETETLVEAVLEAAGPSPVVVDLCTGSGCVALALAQEAGASVWATDIDRDAALTARENAARLGLAGRVTVLEGDLFAPLPPDLLGGVDAVVANPPYVPTADIAALPGEVARFEPARALDGGEDGLDTARRIIAEASRWLRPGGVLAMELDETRVDDAAIVMRAWYEGVQTRRDLTGRPRVVIGRATEANEL
ncbi:MAG: peptide chain release factor N(5)-glutamine methyltransferase [Coriobacteriia bacterium]